MPFRRPATLWLSDGNTRLISALAAVAEPPREAERRTQRDPAVSSGQLREPAVIRILRAAVLGIALSLGASMSLARPVDLELILAVDASLSVSLDEYLMQVRGLAAALRRPEVIAAIERVGDAGIAVAVVQWASAGGQEKTLGWTHIADRASARAFAKRIETMPRTIVGRNTAIGALVEAALPMFRDNGFEGTRRTIDISGDGRSNEGLDPRIARDRAAREGVTINGLAILSQDPRLAVYYRENVVGGPPAFVMSANDYRDFGGAIVTKLIIEIGGPPLARRGGAGSRRATLGRVPGTPMAWQLTTTRTKIQTGRRPWRGL